MSNKEFDDDDDDDDDLLYRYSSSSPPITSITNTHHPYKLVRHVGIARSTTPKQQLS